MTREIVANQLGATTAAEEALERAHAFLAETLRARADAMAQMGHEIRTPLNGIVGTTELLLGTTLSDEQREYAAATMTSATALMIVVNDVLDYSMLEAGTLELDAGAFEVRNLIDGLALAASPRAQSGPAKIRAEFAEEIPGAVTGDGNRIRHVLTKIVASALGHSSSGELTVRVSATTHAAKRMFLRFEVLEASGSFEGDSLEWLFDRYATPGLAGGDNRATGIGLAVCRQLVELMGGEIGVERTVDGTSFWFTTPVGLDGAMPYAQERVRAAHAPGVPAAAKHAAPRRSVPTAKDAGPGQRILIADDDPVSQLVLTRQLEARGFAVAVARNGREALELHKSGDFIAVFMDCQMPEINGFEATVAIREQEADDAHTPIIAMTASAREADREQCFVSGMDDYVAKPLDQVTLDAALARRIPAFDLSDAPEKAAGSRKGATPPLPLLEGSVLTDVFRHNGESRGYLIGVFIEESRARIEQLEAAEALADAETMERLAHALKGSARTIGAKRLEEICAGVQTAASEGRVEVASALRAPLRNCFELTAELLRRGCPEAQGADGRAALED
jgi:CheY-like chemotaxis protein